LFEIENGRRGGGGEALEAAACGGIGIGGEAGIGEGVEGVECANGGAEGPERIEAGGVAAGVQENGSAATPVNAGREGEKEEFGEGGLRAGEENKFGLLETVRRDGGPGFETIREAGSDPKRRRRDRAEVDMEIGNPEESGAHGAGREKANPR